MRWTLGFILAGLLLLGVAGCGSLPLTRVGTLSAVRIPQAAVLGSSTSNPYAYGPIDFVSPQVGFVGEAPGSGLLHTVDGGLHWTRETLPAGYQPQALDFLSASRGIAIAEKGCTATSSPCASALLLTTNGGQRWTVTHLVPVQPGGVYTRYHLSSVPGQATVYAVADQRVYESTDGGQTWVGLTLPRNRLALTVTALSSQSLVVGVAVCSGVNNCSHYAVLQSTDGGRTWGQLWQGSGPPLSLTVVSPAVWYLMAAPNPGMLSMGGAFGSLYETRNAGQTWTQVQSPQQWVNAGEGFPGFQGGAHWANANVGWIPVASGAGGGQGGLEVTGNGGRHWTEIGSGRTWSLGAVALLSPSDGWIAGSARTTTNEPFLLHTTNGGRTWHQVLPTKGPTMTLTMTSPTTGSAVGDASNPHALLITTDGGATWNEISGPPPLTRRARQSVVGSVFFSPNRGSVLVSTAPAGSSLGFLTVYTTGNGGRSWTTAGSLAESGASIYQMTPTGEGLVGLQISYGQGIATTRDGGRHFQSSPFGPKPPTEWIPDLSQDGQVYVLLSWPPHNQWNKPHWTPENLRLGVLNPTNGRVIPIYTWPNPHGRFAYQPLALDMLSQGIGFVLEDQSSRTAHTVQKPVGNGTFRSVPAHRLRLLLWRTLNGGHSWTTVQLPAILNPATSTVSFVNSHIGFVLTTNGVFETRDGGLKWTRRGSP